MTAPYRAQAYAVRGPDRSTDYPLSSWTRGRATLLGDGAHPMLPYLGQGAGQAIEDSCVLATALSVLPDELGAALQLYERSRLPRTTRVVLGARTRGDSDQTPSRWTALKRDALIAVRTVVRCPTDRPKFCLAL